MKPCISRFITDQKGASAIEYSLISALIAVPLIMALSTIGVALAQVLYTVADTLAR